MKGRESGMPEKETWERFFNPERILTTLGLDTSVTDVAELGCGYGTFTIPAARVIRGKVYAIDIEQEMTAITESEADKHGLHNIKTILRDFITEGTGLGDDSVDYVMLFNILHVEQPGTLLQEAWRILRLGGKLGIIHWNYNPATPRGPSMSIRPKPEQCIAWAQASGFSHPMQNDLRPYHYGIMMEKEAR